MSADTQKLGRPNCESLEQKLLLLKTEYLGIDAEELFSYCLTLDTWEQKELVIFGKKRMIPRLSVAYGNSDLTYEYSGITHRLNQLNQQFSILLDKVSNYFNVHFNYILLNLYRNGYDSIGWHSDNERCLGNKIDIAMISLGTTRTFKLKNNINKATVSLKLKHGSLLLMKHPIQVRYKHCLPKMPRITEPRISITFRQIRGQTTR